MPDDCHPAQWRRVVAQDFGPATSIGDIGNQAQLDDAWKAWCSKLEGAFAACAPSGRPILADLGPRVPLLSGSLQVLWEPVLRQAPFALGVWPSLLAGFVNELVVACTHQPPSTSASGVAGQRHFSGPRTGLSSW